MFCGFNCLLTQLILLMLLLSEEGVEQTPGDVSANVIEQLEAVIDTLPPSKKYLSLMQDCFDVP